MRFLRTHPGFSMLWAINFTSSMVGWSMGIALSVHIYQLTGSALWTAFLAATPTVSAIVFGHLAGTVADRWNPLRVVQLTLLARVVVLLGLFVVAESPGWLAILVFVQAAVQQIYRPAEQVLIADFVSAEDLPEANGLQPVRVERDPARCSGVGWLRHRRRRVRLDRAWDDRIYGLLGNTESHAGPLVPTVATERRCGNARRFQISRNISEALTPEPPGHAG